MLLYKLHRISVVNEEGKLVNLITQSEVSAVATNRASRPSSLTREIDHPVLASEHGETRCNRVHIDGSDGTPQCLAPGGHLLAGGEFVLRVQARNHNSFHLSMGVVCVILVN